MSVSEKDILINNVNNGNTEILYPVTKAENVLNLEETINAKITGALEASY